MRVERFRYNRAIAQTVCPGQFSPCVERPLGQAGERGSTVNTVETRGTRTRENEIGTTIVEAAFRVHSRLGSGLLERVYSACLAHELVLADHTVRQEVSLPIRYGGVTLENGYRIDLLIDDLVVIEVKAQEQVSPVHRSQLLSYLRLGGYGLGYLLNFNVTMMRDGVTRMVNGY